MITVYIDSAAAIVVSLTALIVGVTQLCLVVKSFYQSVRNGAAIADLHDCVDQHDRDVRAYVREGVMMPAAVPEPPHAKS